MTNFNNLSSSVERFEEQKKEKVLYIDEAQFRLVHPPKPTETWKQLDEKFKERRNVEKEKLQLKIERQNLVDKYDSLEKEYEELLNSENEINENLRKNFNFEGKYKSISLNNKNKQIIYDMIKDTRNSHNNTLTNILFKLTSPKIPLDFLSDKILSRLTIFVDKLSIFF